LIAIDDAQPTLRSAHASTMALPAHKSSATTRLLGVRIVDIVGISLVFPVMAEDSPYRGW
jgi:hypothetical protein